jgi:hypothetical protein
MEYNLTSAMGGWWVIPALYLSRGAPLHLGERLRPLRDEGVLGLAKRSIELL